MCTNYFTDSRQYDIIRYVTNARQNMTNSAAVLVQTCAASRTQQHKCPSASAVGKETSEQGK